MWHLIKPITGAPPMTFFLVPDQSSYCYRGKASFKVECYFQYFHYRFFHKLNLDGVYGIHQDSFEVIWEFNRSQTSIPFSWITHEIISDSFPLENKIYYNPLYMLTFPNCYTLQYFFPWNSYLFYKTKSLLLQ